MSTLTNRVYLGKRMHNAAFLQCLYCFLRQKRSLEKEIVYLEIMKCDPSIHTMDHYKFIVLNQGEEVISTYRVNQFLQKIMLRNQ